MDAAPIAALGATAAAAVAASTELKPRTGVVAAAAAAGGLTGIVLWHLVGANGGRSSEAAMRRAMNRIDAVHRKQPRRPEDALDELEYCIQTEKWVEQLRGGPELVSPALRLAARAQHLERHVLPRSSFPEGREGYLRWRATVKKRQGETLGRLLRSAGLEDGVIVRASKLVAKDLPLDKDNEMQTLEDAACLVFLKHELLEFEKGKDDAKLVDIFQKTWKKMSRAAQKLSLAFEYEPRVLGYLIEAIAIAEGCESAKPAMVAPRLPAKTVAHLRESWERVNQEAFGPEFLDRLYAECSELRSVFNYDVARPSNIPKAIQVMLDLLDAEQVPRLERVVHAVAALSHHFGSLRMWHMAPIKRAFVRTAVSYALPKEKKSTNRNWEAFFYSLAAVAAPHLVLHDNIREFSASTAASLPTPGGGPHAGAIAAHGAALLEMSLRITALSLNGSQAPEEVLAKLQEAKTWLVDLVRDDVNAYSGLLSTVYGQPAPTQADVAAAVVTTPTGPSAEEAELKRWQRRATEVPLKIAELAMGAAAACLPCRKNIKKTLQGDWLAGAKLLRTATEISAKNASINLKEMGRSDDLDRRLARIRDTEPPWEDLCDM